MQAFTSSCNFHDDIFFPLLFPLPCFYCLQISFCSLMIFLSLFVLVLLSPQDILSPNFTRKKCPRQFPVFWALYLSRELKKLGRTKSKLAKTHCVMSVHFCLGQRPPEIAGGAGVRFQHHTSADKELYCCSSKDCLQGHYIGLLSFIISVCKSIYYNIFWVGWQENHNVPRPIFLVLPCSISTSGTKLETAISQNNCTGNAI